jgi:hypothetical protein
VITHFPRRSAGLGVWLYKRRGHNSENDTAPNLGNTFIADVMPTSGETKMTLLRIGAIRRYHKANDLCFDFPRHAKKFLGSRSPSQNARIRTRPRRSLSHRAWHDECEALSPSAAIDASCRTDAVSNVVVNRANTGLRTQNFDGHRHSLDSGTSKQFLEPGTGAE